MKVLRCALPMGHDGPSHRNGGNDWAALSGSNEAEQ